MADLEFEPKTIDHRLGWLVEECGEVQAAVGKTLRFGLFSRWPKPDGETNRDWILREIQDLKKAIALVEESLRTVPE